ncbi:MAG: hypothetical protein JSR28_18825 [Proteobacteria bacterium]|nr:hypothetical protein [Pseudomonadota bacterium]
MKQTFKGPVGDVAGNDVVKFDRPTIIQADQVTIEMVSAQPAPVPPEDPAATRRRLAAVRAHLWRMFLRHPTGIPYALAWLGFAGLMADFWGHARPFPHGAILLGWGLLVVGPTAWAMARAREAMYYALRNARRELIEAETSLVRAEAERRARDELGNGRGR